jgi:hypothetical protein
VDRKALLARDEARALRHRPAQHDAVEFEPEVVVEARRRVLLDDEGGAVVSVAPPFGSGVFSKSRFARYAASLAMLNQIAGREAVPGGTGGAAWRFSCVAGFRAGKAQGCRTRALRRRVVETRALSAP